MWTQDCVLCVARERLLRLHLRQQVKLARCASQLRVINRGQVCKLFCVRFAEMSLICGEPKRGWSRKKVEAVQSSSMGEELQAAGATVAHLRALVRSIRSAALYCPQKRAKKYSDNEENARAR